MTHNPTVSSDRRVRLGLLLAPLIPAVMWKIAAVLVAPVAFVLLLVAGMPLLETFRKRGWMQWWHALFAGILIAGGVALVYWAVADQFHLDIAGPANTAFVLAYGAAVGFLFWVIAIYKNPLFPQRRAYWPLVIVVVTGLALCFWIYISRLEITEGYGIVVGTPEVRANSAYVPVKLSDGRVVIARADIETARRLVDGRRVGLDDRLGAISATRFYWLNGLCRDISDDTERFKPC